MGEARAAEDSDFGEAVLAFHRLNQQFRPFVAIEGRQQLFVRPVLFVGQAVSRGKDDDSSRKVLGSLRSIISIPDQWSKRAACNGTLEFRKGL